MKGIEEHRSALMAALPMIQGYEKNFASINKRWDGAITAGQIETGRMESEANRLFTPLIQDMGSTKGKYADIQHRLVESILYEMGAKAQSRLAEVAAFTINIVKRNLFERTADVGYLATDSAVVEFVAACNAGENPDASAMRMRLQDYRHEYTVYTEIMLLDTDGYVLAHLDADNTVTRSQDPLLANTLRSCKEYVETFRTTDLRDAEDPDLVYSQAICDPSTGRPIGVLCLFFDFAGEMESVYQDIRGGAPGTAAALLDERGHVISSGKPTLLPLGQALPLPQSKDALGALRLVKVRGRTYLLAIAPNEGYQGFYGLNWYGAALQELSEAMQNACETGADGSCAGDAASAKRLEHFSRELAEIKGESDDLLADMKLDSINGQVKAAKFHAEGFVEVLRFVNWVGEEIDGLLADAVGNLQLAIVESLRDEVRFRAFQGNNIADRNLYERANDVCWWALTPRFRQLMARYGADARGAADHHGPHDVDELTRGLQYINDLYTPYLRLVLVDGQGRVVATSTPPAGLDERVVQEGLPTGQELVGMQLEPGQGRELVRRAMALETPRDYCVSDFAPSPLYGGRPTYVYATAVRHPDSDAPVGAIFVVFDAEPQFAAMLADVLPRNENGEVLEDSFALFVEPGRSGDSGANGEAKGEVDSRGGGRIVASTSEKLSIGSRSPLPAHMLQLERGSRHAEMLEVNGVPCMVGVHASEGYREFKREDSYDNGLLCAVFVPL